MEPGEEIRSEIDAQLYLASERTLLSWIRTGLAMMGFGFVVARFGLFLRETAATNGKETMHPPYATLVLGTALVLIGVFVFLSAGYEHLRTIRASGRGEAFTVPKRSLGLMVAIALSALGIAMAAYLVVVEVMG